MQSFQAFAEENDDNSCAKAYMPTNMHMHEDMYMHIQNVYETQIDRFDFIVILIASLLVDVIYL